VAARSAGLLNTPCFNPCLKRVNLFLLSTTKIGFFLKLPKLFRRKANEILKFISLKKKVLSPYLYATKIRKKTKPPKKKVKKANEIFSFYYHYDESK